MPILDIETNTLDKDGLRQAFRRGSLIREKEMHVLINSSLSPTQNLPSTGSQSLKMTSGSLNFASGSSKTLNWNRIAPPFVPNLHHYIKVFNFDSYTAINQKRTPIGFPDSVQGDISATNTTIWECNTGSLLSFTYDDHFTFGAAKLETGTQASEQNSFQTTRVGNVASISCQKGSKWWVKSRFKIPNIDCKYFIGLFEGNAYEQAWIDNIGVGKSRIGFAKLSSTSATLLGQSLSGTDMNTFNNSTTTNDDIHQIGIHWDGKNLNYYHSSGSTTNFDYISKGLPKMSLVKTISSSIPSESSFRPIFYLQNGSNTAKREAIVEHFQLAIISGSISG